MLQLLDKMRDSMDFFLLSDFRLYFQMELLDRLETT
uniref:Uncharacterized protein n=1 Tax=Ascaris lumbricoides TaxID=6252 RepID=A0A0M3IDX4_ASCLU